eukprot:TRINITY_DN33180_c0_g1_i1.p1 TRINITY_DN33180_c0_g1~~TRINITY_DN33180_c0_g1_i1.p1  ORF type:complete len:124 (-),score=19.26 TRINITY_DN33180_c0_g1_i1:207-578(-)
MLHAFGVGDSERRKVDEGNGLQALWLHLHALEEFLRSLRSERKSIRDGFDTAKGDSGADQSFRNESTFFRMPLHYPRYTKGDYLQMPEWKLDALFKEYGLPSSGDIHQKRQDAISTFLWPDQQ